MLCVRVVKTGARAPLRAFSYTLFARCDVFAILYSIHNTYIQVKLLSILSHSDPPNFSVAMETPLPPVYIYSSSLFTRDLGTIRT